MFDFLVVGAGISGLTFARTVREAGKTVLVIDKRKQIGGNVHCSDLNGIEVHEYGPHIFHTSNQAVWDFVNRFSEWEQYIHSPMAIVGDEIYNLPFNMNLFHRLFGVVRPEDAKKKIEEDRVYYPDPENAEEQALSLVGKTIYEKLIKGYTKKQWGADCNKLAPDVLKRLPLRFDYNNNYFRDKWSAMPKDGYNKFIQNLLGDIPVMLGIDFNSDRDIKNLAKKVVYTGNLEELVGRHFGALTYRSLRFEHEILNTDNYQGCSVVNYNDEDVPFTRITEHKHFRKNYENTGFTIITKEYPLDYNFGLTGAEPFYPVNNSVNDSIYARYREAAEKDGYIVCGRLGDYKYYDMDKAIQAAMVVAQKELWRA